LAHARRGDPATCRLKTCEERAERAPLKKMDEVDYMDEVD